MNTPITIEEFKKISDLLEQSAPPKREIWLTKEEFDLFKEVATPLKDGQTSIIFGVKVNVYDKQEWLKNLQVTER